MGYLFWVIAAPALIVCVLCISAPALLTFMKALSYNGHLLLGTPLHWAYSFSIMGPIGGLTLWHYSLPVWGLTVLWPSAALSVWGCYRTWQFAWPKK